MAGPCSGDDCLAGSNLSRSPTIAFERRDLTSHAEMVLLRRVGRQLQEMYEQDRQMCGSALSIAGIKRIVYAALSEDVNEEQMIVHNLTLA